MNFKLNSKVHNFLIRDVYVSKEGTTGYKVDTFFMVVGYVISALLFALLFVKIGDAITTGNWLMYGSWALFDAFLVWLNASMAYTISFVRKDRKLAKEAWRNAKDTYRK